MTGASGWKAADRAGLSFELSLRGAEAFVAACSTGSMTAAAKQLNKSIQAVSKAVTDLEDQVGFPLLVRKARGVTPTAEGGVAFLFARNALVSLRSLEAVMGALAEGALAPAPPMGEGTEEARAATLCGPREAKHATMPTGRKAG